MIISDSEEEEIAVGADEQTPRGVGGGRRDREGQEEWREEGRREGEGGGGRRERQTSRHVACPRCLQGYLAYKKLPPTVEPRLGPGGGPRVGGSFL